MNLAKQNNVGIYCRLSKEDGNDESQSIKSQKESLVNYVLNQAWQVYDIYTDDGYSGTNFERPDFKRLIKDIENNKINIVVTKDLSRLGRNYIQTGYYIEEYFPSKKVRYIALNDNYDTNNDYDSDIAPFKNIINEWYAKDISKKIKFTLDNQAKNGIAKKRVFPLFGYKYNDCNERIPDIDTAPIVKLIFDKYLETFSITCVANFLKENKIKRPCYYNAIKYGYNKTKILAHDEKYFFNWTNDAVRSILTNYEYTGAYITSKSKSISYKTKKRIKDNPNKFIFDNKYPPLIDKITFYKVQNMINSSNSSSIKTNINIFKGIVRCFDCGKPLRFERRFPNKKNKNLVYRYYCNNKNCNNSNTIKLDKLSKIVIKEMMTLKKIILNHQNEFIQKVQTMNLKKNLNIEFNIQYHQEIENYQKRINEIDKLIKILFEKNINGNIIQKVYESLLNNYLKEKEFLNEQITIFTNNQNKQKNNFYEIKNLIKQLELINENNILDANTVRSFIKWILVKKQSKNYIFTFKYSKLDEIIKEFLENEE